MISYYLFGKDRYTHSRRPNLAVSPNSWEDKELISASITFPICYANTISEILPDSLFTALLLQAPPRDTAPVTGDQRFASVLPFSQTAIRQHRDAKMSVSIHKSTVSKEMWVRPCIEGMPLRGQHLPSMHPLQWGIQSFPPACKGPSHALKGWWVFVYMDKQASVFSIPFSLQMHSALENGFYYKLQSVILWDLLC